MIEKEKNQILVVLFFSLTVIFILISITIIVLFSSQSVEEAERVLLKNEGERELIFPPHRNEREIHLTFLPPKETPSFGKEEYKCHGSCICEEEEKRRVAGSQTISISKGLIFIITAVSSSLAYGLAKKRFEMECWDNLESTCSSPESTIRAEVEKCEKILHDESSLHLQHQGKKSSPFIENWEQLHGERIRALSEHEKEVHYMYLHKMEESLKNISFSCHGECLNLNEHHDIKKYIKEADNPEAMKDINIIGEKYFKIMKNIDCSKHVLERIIKLETPSLKFLESDQNIYPAGITPRYFAEAEFTASYLEHFCVDVGLQEVFEKFQGIDYKKYFIPPPICHGHFGNTGNPSVTCKEHKVILL